MRPYSIGCALIFFFISALGCSRGRGEAKFETVAAVQHALRRAIGANDAQAVYALLDRPTQWSVISALRTQRRIRKTVRTSYPADRRAQELRRTRWAAATKDPADFFFAVANERQLLPKVESFSSRATMISASGAQRGENRIGKGTLVFCREDNDWRYCGLREIFESIKIRTARDLELVEESVKHLEP